MKNLQTNNAPAAVIPLQPACTGPSHIETAGCEMPISKAIAIFLTINRF